MKKLIVVVILALVGAAPLCADDELAAAVAADYESSLEELFVWFHQNAELSFREFETAKRLAEELRAAGVEVTEGVGGTGVVGMLRNGDGPLVMVRADMDGLPIAEDSGLSYASTAMQEDIDGKVKLQLTVRAENQQTRQQLLDGIERIALNTARAAGMPEDLLPEVVVTEGTPPTVNDRELAERVKEAFLRELGADAVFEEDRQGMGAEDFSYFVLTDELVPGAYFSVGGTAQVELDAEEAGGPKVPSHHSPFFKIEPEPSVTMGTRAMTVAVLELLGIE
jgi:metal-dependent amidase/aminoacylase/carboxypeptidase family protein